jgi:hypothetical protein
LSISTRATCNATLQAYMSITGTPDLGADGKDDRANSVHAPFPEKDQHLPPPRTKVRRCQSAKIACAFYPQEVFHDRHP